MSGRIVEEVLDYAPDDLPRLDLMVLVALAAEARDSDRTAKGKHTGAEALAGRVRTSPASVRNALARLRQRALIRPVHEKARRGQQQNWVITKLSDYHREGARLCRDDQQPGTGNTAPTAPGRHLTAVTTGT